jgi:hypothetical protein
MSLETRAELLISDDECEPAPKWDAGAFCYNPLIYNKEIRVWRGSDRRP